MTKIVNSINDGKPALPKIKLQFDTSEAKEAINGLKKELEALQKLAEKINVGKGDSGKRKKKDKNSDEAKTASENYKKLTASVKQYHSALTDVQRIAMKSSSVSQDGDTWKTTDEQYQKRIDNLNKLGEQYGKLQVQHQEDGTIEIANAKELGIS